MSEKKKIHFVLNGNPVECMADPASRLVDLLRNQFRLTGTKEGCAIGECGACTVVLNGAAVTSCSVLAGQAENKDIWTIEGMEKTEIGRALQSAFVRCGAVQCGFCTPGMIMSAYALLLENPAPTRDEIRLAMSGNLCRCTGYVPIVDAIETAARELREHSHGSSPVEDAHGFVIPYKNCQS